MKSLPRPTQRQIQSYTGFTLIELLVVISIIALLIGILLPVLGAARSAGRSAASLSNVRQMGIALTVYNTENKGYMPMHSSSSSPGHPAFANPRTRWPDHLFDLMPNTEIYLSPNLTADELDRFKKLFAHTAGTGDEKYFGGYGYNFQYLGNSRYSSPTTFHARVDVDITQTSNTVFVGDTAGSRKGVLTNEPGTGAEAVYVIDPPLPAIWTANTWGAANGYAGQQRAHGDGTRAYYPSGSTAELSGDADSYLWRSFPDERNNGAANFAFADGHGAAFKMADIDDFDGDGTKDNGYFNGHGDPNVQ